MAHVTREQLDRLLEQTLLLDDHGALARQLDTLAEAYQTGEVSRAAILVLAAEEWRQAGQPDTALDRFQRAADDGGEVQVDPRSGIADTWTPGTALTIAETLVAYGDLTGAHQWATEGVIACLPGTTMRDALLRTRYRIRVDLGLPEDDLDALLDVYH